MNELNQMAFFFLAGAMQFQIRACVVEPMQWTGWRHKWTKTRLQELPTVTGVRIRFKVKVRIGYKSKRGEG